MAAPGQEDLRRPRRVQGPGGVHRRRGAHPELQREPQGLFCWFILGTEREKLTAKSRASEIEAEARRLLAQVGFPAVAIPSFKFGYTCQPEIDAGGGRFAFFR